MFARLLDLPPAGAILQPAGARFAFHNSKSEQASKLSVQRRASSMALVVASLALHAALASGMHRYCSAGSSPSLRRSAPLLVQTNTEVCRSLTPTADASRRREAGARSVSSSPSLRCSAPLMVQTNPEVWQPHDDEEHPNEAPGTGQPRAEVGASFGLLRGRRLPRRELASEWIDAGVPKWVTLIDEALFVLARHAPCIH